MTWFAKFAEDKAISRRVTSPPPPSQLIHKKKCTRWRMAFVYYLLLTHHHHVTNDNSNWQHPLVMLSFCDVRASVKIPADQQLLTPATFTFNVILIPPRPPPLSHLDASLKLQQVALVFMFSIAVVIQAGATRGQYYRTVWKSFLFFSTLGFFFSPLTYVLQEESLPLLRWLMGMKHISSDTHLCECRDEAEASDG